MKVADAGKLKERFEMPFASLLLQAEAMKVNLVNMMQFLLVTSAS
jgi:hypothetical protein